MHIIIIIYYNICHLCIQVIEKSLAFELYRDIRLPEHPPDSKAQVKFHLSGNEIELYLVRF